MLTDADLEKFKKIEVQLKNHESEIQQTMMKKQKL